MFVSPRDPTGPVLAVIPARAGSKGLPRKNLRLLAGKPLVIHSIEHARATPEIDDVVVSTDDDEIAGIAASAGASVLRRPPELAADDTPTLPVLLPALEHYRSGRTPSRIITLQPTSPLRRPTDITGALALLTTSCDAVVGVCAVEHSPYKMFRVDDDSLLPLLEGFAPGTPRQQLPPVFRENGAVYVTWRDVLVNQRSIWGARTRPFLMDARSSVDIDTSYDLTVAEVLLQESEPIPAIA